MTLGEGLRDPLRDKPINDSQSTLTEKKFMKIPIYIELRFFKYFSVFIAKLQSGSCANWQ